MASTAGTIQAEKAALQQRYNSGDSQLESPFPHPASPLSASATGNSSRSPLESEADESFHEGPVDPNSLPPYSGPSSESQVNLPQRPAPRGPQRYPGLPRLDYRLYSPPLFELTSDCNIKSTAPYLSSTVGALVSLVRAQSTIPPKPQIHIRGNRGRRVDFDVKLNLMPLLIPEDPRQRMDYLRCVGQGEPALRGGAKRATLPDVGPDEGLEAWCRRFVEDPAPVKIFTLERQVANMDINWLEGQIRSMVAATNYKGVVAVTFPVTHARVVVQSPDRVNKFITSVTTLFSGKNQYEVVKAVWPFATHKNGEQGRRCAVQSEETWWREWRDPIRFAIATKRTGWVTNEDKLEAIMEGKGKGVSTVDWGPDEEW
jgi:hypothetical protein